MVPFLGAMPWWDAIACGVPLLNAMAGCDGGVPLLGAMFGAIHGCHKGVDPNTARAAIPSASGQNFVQPCHHRLALSD